jgi:hypothetical protein
MSFKSLVQNELEVKDTTDTQKYTSCFNFHIEIDKGGILKTRANDKRIMNSLFWEVLYRPLRATSSECWGLGVHLHQFRNGIFRILHHQTN